LLAIARLDAAKRIAWCDRFASGLEDFAQNTAGWSWDFDDGLVGIDFQKGFVLPDLRARLPQPALDNGLGALLLHVGQGDVNDDRHDCP
jgi:hypothetical protein